MTAASFAEAQAEAEAEAEVNMANDHPFGDEKPAADGSFYPHDLKLRRASDDEPVIIKDDADIPPYCILIPGQAQIFTFKPPINSSGDKSGPNNAMAILPST